MDILDNRVLIRRRPRTELLIYSSTRAVENDCQSDHDDALLLSHSSESASQAFADSVEDSDCLTGSCGDVFCVGLGIDGVAVGEHQALVCLAFTFFHLVISKAYCVLQ